MPHHDSPSPVRRPLMNERTSPASSFTQVSGGLPSPTQRASTHKPQHKAHTAGRIAHARNPSYGRNLNKLTKLHGNEENGPTKRAKQHTPSTSPSAHDIRRNSSNVSLPHVGSRTSMKRNSSNSALKRNGSSHTQLGKTGRPTTPSRNANARGKGSNRNKANDSAKFTVGSEGHDDEWTEESASQSPSTTRQSSAHGQPLPQETPPPDEAPIARAQPNLPASPPDSPAETSSAEEEHTESDHPRANPPTVYHSARAPDADVVTSRLISRQASLNLPPQVSSISVAGTPGMHTPPIYNIQGSTPATNLSMPENGVSCFLNATGSSSGASNTAAHLHTALNNIHDSPSTNSTGNRSPSPNPAGPEPADAVRRAKSTGNLTNSSGATTIRPTTESGRQSPPSYSVDPRQHRRPGGNTAAKLELWRTQVNIESPQGPSSLAIRGVPGSLQPNMLGTEDRRVKLWEIAEGQMGYLRRFRNPVLEGVGRALKAHKSKSKGKAKSVDGRSLDLRSTYADSQKDSRGRGSESRPPSAGRRSVRFDTGADGAGVSGSEVDGEEELEGLLRRMWVGDEGGEGYAGS
ncbi:hypothetical protein MMC30_000768 [Trapelia coarctata]|nr:hypothetical protein [Trapelia coarctata]